MEKAVVKLLQVKMLVVPGLIRMNPAARGEMMCSLVWVFGLLGGVRQELGWKLPWPPQLQISCTSHQNYRCTCFCWRPRAEVLVVTWKQKGRGAMTYVGAYGQKKNICQQSLVLVKHAVQTDSKVASRAAWKPNQTNAGVLTHKKTAFKQLVLSHLHKHSYICHIFTKCHCSRMRKLANRGLSSSKRS